MSEIILPHNFTPREYQIPMYAAMDGGIKRAVKCWHRRGGKDVSDLNYMIKEMVRVPENYWYVLPSYNQARKAIWENKTKDGFPYLGFFPQKLVKRIRHNDMMVELVNDSIFRLLGGDKVDSIVGAGPRGIVMSEYSLHKPSTWQYLEPMILEKDGWAIFNLTPRGHNHAYDLVEMAKENPRWFWQICTVDDTGVVSKETIDNLREEGRPEEIIQQEFYCSFEGSIYGAYYGRIMTQLTKDGRISNDVGYEPLLPVYTAWDLGVSDSTAIWFYQISVNQVRIIDYYENSGEGIPHYVKELRKKDYVYGKHFAPHDIKVRELGTGKSRIETAKSLGLEFEVVPSIPIEDGIEAVRSLLPRCWFAKASLKDGIESLKQYRKEYDEKNKSFHERPLHDWTSHAADAFRYLAVSIDQAHPSTSFSYDELYN